MRTNRASAKGMITHKMYYTLYIILFTGVFAVIFSGYWINGKSFVFCDTYGGGDGLVQHFNSFVYYGKYLRSIITNLFSQKTLIIPQWDMSIGFGQDIITTLSYYVIGDPFSVLSVFCPARYAEYLYNFLIVLRLFLAGITFSIYARYHGYRSILTLCGTIIYVFSSYTLLASTLHPYFTNPLVYLPLLLLGIDRIFEKKGPGLYAAMIALSAISNFYFFYMLCLIVVIYVIFRFFYTVKSNKCKELIKYFLTFAALSLLGIGMAMVLFMPTVFSILNSNRVGADVIVRTFYDGKYYLNYLGAFLSGSAGYYTHLGYTGVGLISVIVLLIRLRKAEKKNLFMAAGFFLLTVFLLLPFFGHLFNGLSYVTNRWIWAYAFTVSMIVVMMLPEMAHLTKKELVIVSLVSFLYAAVVFSVPLLQTEANMAAVACLFLVLIALFAVHLMADIVPASSLFPAVTAIALIVNSSYVNQVDNSNYILRFTDSGTALSSLIKDSPGYQVSEVNDTGLYRYDTGGFSTDRVKRNSAMLLNLNSCAYYYSMANEYVSAFFKAVNLKTPMEQSYNDLNSRLILDSLMGVKYFIVENGKEAYLPYGYSEIVTQNDSYTVYENKDVLPIVFTASDYISEKEYESFSALEKQQLLAQTIVLTDHDQLKKAVIDIAVNETPYELSCSEKIEIKVNSIVVDQANEAVTIHFNAAENTEYYVVFNGLRFTETNPLTDRFWKASDAINIKVDAANVSHYVKYLTPESPYYNDIHSFICNVGIMEEGEKTITITFPKAGTYSFDSFTLQSQPVNTISRSMHAFCEDDTSDFREITNGIEGTVTLDKTKMLCISVPYSENWTAYVDGTETKIDIVDQFMAGIKLAPGTHTVQLLYRNRNLSTGLILSMISIVIFIIMESSLLIYRRKRVL